MHIYILSPRELKCSTLLTIYYISMIIYIVLSTQISLVAARHESMQNRNMREHNFGRIQKRDGQNLVTDPSPKTESQNVSHAASSSTKAPTEVKSTIGNPVPDKENCTSNCTVKNGKPNFLGIDMAENKEMLLRTLYVTLGITGIIVLYFVSRAVWLRRKRTKARKYRVIAQNGDHRDLEMEPLGDGNDDDEDYTVFEVNGRRK